MVPDFTTIISEHWDEFSGDLKRILEDNYSEYLDLQNKIMDIDRHIKNNAKNNEQCCQLQEINGMGPLTAWHDGDGFRIAHRRIAEDCLRDPQRARPPHCGHGPAPFPRIRHHSRPLAEPSAESRPLERPSGAGFMDGNQAASGFGNRITTEENMETIVRALHSTLSVMRSTVIGLSSGQTDIFEGSMLLNRERAKFIAAAKALRLEAEMRWAAFDALFSKTA